jgi:hypothetical protein
MRNQILRGIGHGEAMHRNYKRPELSGDQAYDRSADLLNFRVVKFIKP